MPPGPGPDTRWCGPLMNADRPRTPGKPLPDAAIYDRLIVFMLAGHDTTATTLTHARWRSAGTGWSRIACARRWPRQPPRPDTGGRTAADLHRPGAARGTSAVPTRCGDLPDRHARHRDRRIPGRGRLGPAGFGGLGGAARSGAGRIRCGSIPTVSRPAGQGAGSLAVPALRGRTPICIGDHFAMLEAWPAIVGRCQISSLSDDFPFTVPFTTVAGAGRPWSSSGDDGRRARRRFDLPELLAA